MTLNKKGLTLIEVMIALVVLLLVFIGLMQAAVLSIDHNLRNILRDEAINIASERMSELNNTPFGTLAVGTNCQPISRNFRNLTKPYNVCDVIANLDASINTRTVQVVVGWNHKSESPLQAPTGSEFQHSMTTVRRR